MAGLGVVIVGAGLAGCTAAVHLRSRGYERPITLIGDESYPPYHRPPLSKAYLLGEVSRERLFLRPASYFETHDIALRLERRVGAISLQDRCLSFGGQRLGYEALILATGSTPLRFPDARGGSLAGVYTLRGIADIDAMAPEFVAGRRLVIVGGGYIGLEVAAVACKRGLKVTVIEAGARILQRVAARPTSDFFRALHQSHGVKIVEGKAVESVCGVNRVEAVALADNTRHPADFVIFGMGIRPETALAESAGLAVENGIVTDENGRTSDPYVWAAGDCASWPFRGGQVRFESVGSAIGQAEAIAARIAGLAPAYLPQPWFWSDQYHVKLQIAGFSAGYDQVVSRSSSEGSLSVWYYRKGRLIAVDAMNDPKSYMSAKRWLAAGRSPEPEKISNAKVDLKTVLDT